MTAEEKEEKIRKAKAASGSGSLTAKANMVKDFNDKNNK